jgi:hypothetical protein
MFSGQNYNMDEYDQFIDIESGLQFANNVNQTRNNNIRENLSERYMDNVQHNEMRMIPIVFTYLIFCIRRIVNF